MAFKNNEIRSIYEGWKRWISLRKKAYESIGLLRPNDPEPERAARFKMERVELDA